jgi:hypothetical protein
MKFLKTFFRTLLYLLIIPVLVFLWVYSSSTSDEDKLNNQISQFEFNEGFEQTSFTGIIQSISKNHCAYDIGVKLKNPVSKPSYYDDKIKPLGTNIVKLHLHNGIVNCDDTLLNFITENNIIVKKRGTDLLELRNPKGDFLTYFSLTFGGPIIEISEGIFSKSGKTIIIEKAEQGKIKRIKIGLTGDTLSICNYHSSTRTDRFTKYYRNNSISIIGNYSKGIRDNNWIYMYLNGDTLKTTTNKVFRK